MSLYDEILNQVKGGGSSNTPTSKSGGSYYNQLLSQIRQPLQQPQQTQQIPQPPAITQKFGGTIQTLADLQTDPLNLKGNIKQAVPSVWSNIKGAFNKVATNAGNLVNALDFSTWGKGAGSELGGSILESAAGAANLALSPITALFEGANKVPILGSISRLVSLPFSVATESAVQVADWTVNKLPISEESKDNLRPGVEEIYALASMIILGKGMDVAGKKFLPSEKKATIFRNNFTKDNPAYRQDIGNIGTNKINKIVDNHGTVDAGTIIRTSIELARQKKGLPIVNRALMNVEQPKPEIPQPIIENKLLNEPNKPKQLPPPSGITSGEGFNIKPTASKLEIARTKIFKTLTDAQAKYKINKTVNNLKKLQDSMVAWKNISSIEETPVKPNTTQNINSNISSTNPLGNQVVGKTKGTIETPIANEMINPSLSKTSQQPYEPNISKTAQDIRNKAIADGLTKDFGELPGIPPESAPLVKQNSLRLAHENPELAKKVASGDALAPEGTTPQSVYSAVRIKANLEGDLATLQDLVNHSTIPTEAGRALQYLDTTLGHDVTKIYKNIQDIKKGKIKSYEEKVLPNEIKSIKSELTVKETTSWNKFLDKIICG